MHWWWEACQFEQTIWVTPWMTAEENHSGCSVRSAHFLLRCHHFLLITALWKYEWGKVQNSIRTQACRVWHLHKHTLQLNSLFLTILLQSSMLVNMTVTFWCKTKTSEATVRENMKKATKNWMRQSMHFYNMFYSIRLITVVLTNIWPHETHDSNLHAAQSEHMLQLSYRIWLDVVSAVPKWKMSLYYF